MPLRRLEVHYWTYSTGGESLTGGLRANDSIIDRTQLYTHAMRSPACSSTEVQQALAASASGDAATALRLFRQACAEFPADAMPPFLLGAELAQAGHYGDAEVAYAAAVNIEPGFAIARYELGTLQFTSGRVDEALATWEPLRAGGPEALQLYVAGYAALAKDRFDAACDLFRRGLQAGSANPALDANIRLVLGAIDAKVALRSRAPEQAEPPSAHYLLGAYRDNAR